MGRTLDWILRGMLGINLLGASMFIRDGPVPVREPIPIERTLDEPVESSSSGDD